MTIDGLTNFFAGIGIIVVLLLVILGLATLVGLIVSAFSEHSS